MVYKTKYNKLTLVVNLSAIGLKMAQKLSDSLKTAILEAFDSVDIHNAGDLNKDGIREVLQLIGQNPTQAEMDTCFEIGIDTVYRDSMSNFIEENFILKSQSKIDNEIAEAFAKFAAFDENDKTVISKAEFREVLTTLGDETLTETQAELIMKTLNHDDNGALLDVSDLSKLLRG